MHGREYCIHIPFGSPQYPPHHNIPWQGCCVSHEHSSIAEKEPEHPRFFSVVHLAAAFCRAVKKKKLFSIKIDKYVLTNRVKMCNKKRFRVVFTRVSKVVFALVDRIRFPPLFVRYVYLLLSFHWLTDFSASSKAINWFLVYDTQ